MLVWCFCSPFPLIGCEGRLYEWKCRGIVVYCTKVLYSTLTKVMGFLTRYLEPGEDTEDHGPYLGLCLAMSLV